MNALALGASSMLPNGNNASAPRQEGPDATGSAEDDAGGAGREGGTVPRLSRPSGDRPTRSVGDHPREDRPGAASANFEPVQGTPGRVTWRRRRSGATGDGAGKLASPRKACERARSAGR